MTGGPVISERIGNGKTFVVTDAVLLQYVAGAVAVIVYVVAVKIFGNVSVIEGPDVVSEGIGVPFESTVHNAVDPSIV